MAKHIRSLPRKLKAAHRIKSGRRKVGSQSDDVEKNAESAVSVVQTRDFTRRSDGKNVQETKKPLC